MEIAVGEVVLEEASKCIKAHACLTNPGGTCCPVVRVLHDIVYYVRRTHDNFCPYETRFLGKTSSCACPVRKRIHNRYHM